MGALNALAARWTWAAMVGLAAAVHYVATDFWAALCTIETLGDDEGEA